MVMFIDFSSFSLNLFKKKEKKKKKIRPTAPEEKLQSGGPPENRRYEMGVSKNRFQRS